MPMLRNPGLSKWGIEKTLPCTQRHLITLFCYKKQYNLKVKNPLSYLLFLMTNYYSYCGVLFMYNALYYNTICSFEIIFSIPLSCNRKKILLFKEFFLQYKLKKQIHLHTRYAVNNYLQYLAFENENTNQHSKVWSPSFSHIFLTRNIKFISFLFLI